MADNIKKLNNNLIVYGFLTVLFVILRYINKYEDCSNMYFFCIIFMLQFAISISIIFYFAITVNKRVMNKNIKINLWCLSALLILWLVFKNLKWRGLTYLDFESRFMWYLFYIPMTLIPFFCLLIAIYMGKKEDYKINKKWYLLCAPIILIILLVLTNDIHQYVFSFNKDFINWDKDYAYNYGYYFVLSFIICLIILATIILIRKWRIANKNRQVYKIYAILALGSLYVITYIINRPIANDLLDLTTFNCLFLVIFWEALIQIGLIPSNKNHKMFFEKSGINAQILDVRGNRIIPINHNINISKNRFNELNKNKILQINKKILLQIKEFDNGYIVWSKDVSKNIEMNEEIEVINSELYNEIDFLKEKSLLEKERSRVKKLNSIYDLINKEIEIPRKELSKRINKVKNVDEIKQNGILKEINIISCYIKRKVNLLLKIDDDKYISNDDMISCYNESFRGLGLFNISSSLKYNLPIETPINVHIVFYDIFERVIEKLNFNINMMLINCSYDKGTVRFSMIISKTKKINIKDLYAIINNELKLLNNKVIIEENEESLEIIIKIKKEDI